MLEEGIGGLLNIARGCGTQVIKKLDARLTFFNCIEPMHESLPSFELAFVFKSLELQVGVKTFQVFMQVLNSVLDQLFNYDDMIFFQQDSMAGQSHSPQKSEEDH